MFKCFRGTKKKEKIQDPPPQTIPEILQIIEKPELKIENVPQSIIEDIASKEEPKKQQKPLRFQQKFNYGDLDFSRVKQRKINALILTDDQIKSWEKGKTTIQAFKHLAKGDSQFMKEPQKLSINMRRYRENLNKNLKYISQFIKELRDLKSLRLDFGGCFRLTEAGLKHLAENLKNLKHLQEISLDFNHCSHIGDKEMEEIGKIFKALRSLKKVNLNFFRCIEVTDVGIIALSRALRPLMSLQDLSLNFKECRKTSNIGIRHLAENIKKFSLMKSLSLNFVWCPAIDGKGINNLSQALESFKFLTTIMLNFESCSSISEESLQNLVQCLGKLALLQNLCLNFGKCNGVTFGILESLSVVLKRLVCLQSLVLNFQRCNNLNLTSEKLKDYCQILIELNSLQRLEANFTNYICLSRMNDLLRIIKERKITNKISFNLKGFENMSQEQLTLLDKEIKLWPGSSYQLGFDPPKGVLYDREKKVTESVQGKGCPLMRREDKKEMSAPLVYVFLKDGS